MSEKVDRFHPRFEAVRQQMIQEGVSPDDWRYLWITTITEAISLYRTLSETNDPMARGVVTSQIVSQLSSPYAVVRDAASYYRAIATADTRADWDEWRAAGFPLAPDDDSAE